MSEKPIRTGQLIAPFGPGSLYTDRRGTTHVVCGIDHWYTRWDAQSGRTVECDHPDEFERVEPRLGRLLRVSRFRTPPDHRAVRRGMAAPPNAGLDIPAHRFPTWHRHSRTGRLRQFNLTTRKLGPAPDSGRWVPVRFVAVCAAGHLCEFPWKKWSQCVCTGEGELHLDDAGGSELSSIRVYCRRCRSSDRRGLSLAGVTQRPVEGETGPFARHGISCPGERPWLGRHASEQCGESLVGALINQTNLYFPRVISSLLLPEIQEMGEEVAAVRELLLSDPGGLSILKLTLDFGRWEEAVSSVKRKVGDEGLEATDEQVQVAIRSIFEPSWGAEQEVGQPSQPESELLGFRRAEFNVLRRRVDDPVRAPDLRVIPTEVSPGLSGRISSVHLVERLRETRVFYGFDRLEPDPRPLTGMPESAMKQLFRDPPTEPRATWLPAMEVFGEGIYMDIDNDAILKWQEENASWLGNRLSQAFMSRIIDRSPALAPVIAAGWEWASRYLLVHTTAHILINQLVFECGYSTASLRERLYVSNDDAAPMSGLLVYTAAGDSEGTLGGLVRLGRHERFEAVLARALSRASWCSADPVCSENLGGQGSFLANLAACHACALLPETSCETMNHGLDRAMVVGTPYERDRGFFSGLLQQAYEVER